MRLILPILLLVGMSAHAQESIEADYVLHRHITLREPQMVQKFLDEFKFDLAEVDRSKVTHIEYVDTMNDGYTVNDIFVVRPQGLQVLVTHLSNDLKRLMESWADPTPLQVERFPLSSEGFAQYESDEDSDLEDSCLRLRMLTALQQSYDGAEIGFHVTLNADGYAVQTWKVNPADIIPPEGGCLQPTGSGGRRLDLLLAQSQDTVWVPDTVMVDLLYIVQTQTDSIFTSKGPGRRLSFEEQE
ncbi:MAG: hypothetical protein KDC10_07995 [Calditrichaeota bacterium]|nr:hypothetical protein [Calditrichota bacterium]MCB9473394.1 hypothetical protein [Candidatus Delongbacteria bacterium]